MYLESMYIQNQLILFNLKIILTPLNHLKYRLNKHFNNVCNEYVTY